MKVRFSAATDVGRKRKVNQDSYRVGDPSPTKGQLLVVCDGMGGHAAGEVASQIGVDTILTHYYRSEQPDRTTLLEQAFSKANQIIYERGNGRMGTTGVAALLLQNKLFVANVGDSRAYIIRDKQITQISRDHSLVEEQVAAGILTPDQARNSSYRNMITRALGHLPDVQVDLFKVDIEQGDLVVLSSDGMHGLIEDAEIVQFVGKLDPKDAVQRLVDEANARGGPDNITVVIALIEELGENNPPDVTLNTARTQTVQVAPAPKKKLLVGGLLLAAIAVVALGLGVTFGWGGKATAPASHPSQFASPKSKPQTTVLTPTRVFTTQVTLKLTSTTHLTPTKIYSSEIEHSRPSITHLTPTMKIEARPIKPTKTKVSPTPTSSG